MRNWKETAEFVQREVCMIFCGICIERVFYFVVFAVLETWNSLFVKPETWNLWICFVWFFLWTVISGICCRCHVFMPATVDVMTCLRVLIKPLWPVDHFMFARHVHDSCLCCCDCWLNHLFMRSSMEWRSMSFIRFRNHSRFPMDWGWRTVFHIRKTFCFVL